MWFNQKGIYTVLDLLYFIPMRYEDRSHITAITEAEEGALVLVRGRVILSGEERFHHSRKRLFRIRIQDSGGILELIWFHYRKPHLAGLAALGTNLLAYGLVRTDKAGRQMIHPEIHVTEGPGDEGTGYRFGIYPVYSAGRGIPAKAVRSAIEGALKNHLPSLVDPVPGEIAAALGLPDLATALGHVHFPSGSSSIEDLNQFRTPYHKRLTFDRFFLVMLIIAYLKKVREKRQGAVWPTLPAVRKDIDRKSVV